MKHQNFKDRMHEHEGMMHHKGHSSGHAMYRNEVEKPEVPPHGHQEMGMGVHDFKGEAQDIAYGQAGEMGCRSDEKKMASQFKNYHWDSDTGGASGY